MAWKDEAVALVRGIIGDFSPPYSYCDERLEDIFLMSAKVVMFEIQFSQGYSINLSASTITPEPSIDDAILTLGALKAGVYISNSEYKQKAAGAITLVDGPSTINLAASATAFKDRAAQIAKDYEQAKKQYVFGQGRGFGVVLTPTTSPGTGPENVYTSSRFQYVPYTTYQFRYF